MRYDCLSEGYLQRVVDSLPCLLRLSVLVLRHCHSVDASLTVLVDTAHVDAVDCVLVLASVPCFERRWEHAPGTGV